MDIGHITLSPNSITPTFTETSPWGKSWTQIMKVMDTNHLDPSRCLRQSLWQVCDKPVCVALAEFSQLQCMGKVNDKVCDKVQDKFATKSRTQIMKVGDVICIADFHVLCLQQVRDFVANLSRLFRKISIMEFGLYISATAWQHWSIVITVMKYR